MRQPKHPPVPTGTVFGRLTTLEEGVRGEDKILVRCECGTEKRVSLSSLRHGRSKSCGCGMVEARKKSAVNHVWRGGR